jgi:hypothetical protein
MGVDRHFVFEHDATRCDSCKPFKIAGGGRRPPLSRYCTGIGTAMSILGLPVDVVHGVALNGNRHGVR